MAIKKVTGGKKPIAKKASVKKTASKPKAKVTKSRGSNTPIQVGNDNQREGYNAIRDTSAARYKGGSGDSTARRSKTSAQEVKSNKKWEKDNRATMSVAMFSDGDTSAISRKKQRAGGKGK
jgi:hypothetical protein